MLITLPTVLLAWAALLLVPLGVAVSHDRKHAAGLDHRAQAALRRLLLPAAALLCSSMLLDPGLAAGALAVPWLLVCSALAALGGLRILSRGVGPLHALAVDVAAVYLAGGAVWALCWRAGWPLLGYAPFWVMLTAVHFHVAGFALPVLTAVLARLQPGRAATLALIGSMAGVPLTAVGIATSRPIEITASIALACAAVVTGALALAEARRRAGAQRALLVTAALSIVVAMALAVNYALGTAGLDLRLGPWNLLETMAMTHGVLNAVGFAGAGLLFARLAGAAVPSGVATVRRGDQ